MLPRKLPWHQGLERPCEGKNIIILENKESFVWNLPVRNANIQWHQYRIQAVFPLSIYLSYKETWSSTISCCSVRTTTVIHHLQMKGDQQENAQLRLDFWYMCLCLKPSQYAAYIAIQNISRITAEMSRSPASISSINSVCYHDNKAWRFSLTNIDFFFFFPKHSSVCPVSAFVSRGGGHQNHQWHNSWEVTRAIPQIHLSSSYCFQDVSKWDDWHNRWKIRFQTSLSFLKVLQSVEVTVFMAVLAGENAVAMSHLC